MITLEFLLENDTKTPIAFGYTSDYKEVISRILKINKPAKRIFVLINGICLYSLDNNKFRATSIKPIINEFLFSYANAGLENSTIICLGTDFDMVPFYKHYYDNGLSEITNQSSVGNLIANEVDAKARLTGVEEYKEDTARKKCQPSIIFISKDTAVPKELANACINIGLVDIKKHENNPTYSGLNTIEKEYVGEILKHFKSNQHSAVTFLRKSILGNSKVLKDIPVVEDVNNIGGYNKAKDYFINIGKYIKKEKGRLKVSGSVIIGPAGTGKSRLITAIPTLMGLPGYVLDLNSAMGSLQGMSEQAVIDALEKAKKISPVCLLIDEIEKNLSGIQEGQVAGNEVAGKIFGIILTAMAEDNGIYWVASSNDMSKFPDEFKRKGRFDHMWYVGLPNVETRAKILGVHCKLNDIDIKKIDIPKICSNTENWTGAEICHICRQASVKAIANDICVTTDMLMAEINDTKGIIGNSKKIQQLEEWARENAISVD